MDSLGECEVLRDASSIPDIMFKLIVIGEASVGKSCLMNRAVKDEFEENYEITVGAESSTFIVKIKESIVQLQIWDTAGTEKFRSMIRVFFTGSNGAFLVYDITRKHTFEALDFWLNMLRENTTPDIKIVLVGNKRDQETAREVPYDSGRNYAEKNGLFGFVETSAKTGEGVVDVFKKIAMALYSENQSGATEDKDKVKLEKKKKKKKGCCQKAEVFVNEVTIIDYYGCFFWIIRNLCAITIAQL
eukprot:TRINITY_DN89203_c0_g1_i1.p1 TRINITY_DN89203_c0_g1~~TRINITY_DN89203_c0_g1_i1.p1  ORF type:complete len:245 (-),score=29.64 TRINITY_DN89203_c0_g1_i1:43-777(-)